MPRLMSASPTIHLPPGVGRDLIVTPPQRRLKLIQPNNMTASAVRVTKGNGQDFRRLIQPWQARALSYYDMIGEVWYSAQFYARALGKTRLFPALLDENGDPQPTDDPLLNELWDRVQGPGGGRAHLQEQYGRLMFLTGEGYLTATPDDDWGEVWEFLSSDELRVQPGGVFVRYSAPQLDAITYVDAPDDAFTPIANQTGPDAIVPYRLWRPSPRYSAWADSPMRAVLEICEEVVLLTLAVRSRAKSRAANGGLLLWPQNASIPQLDTSGSEDATNDPFAEEIGESMMAPISDPGTASAAVPMIVFMDAQYIQEKDGGPRLMQLVDPKDNYGETGLRNEAIRRFALGVDMPPEQLLGMGDSNHWSSWQVDEQSYKAHLQPVTERMCEDFNSAYLRRAAREAGYANWKKVAIGYDATEVINHPDKGKDFMDMYDRRVVSKEALRRAKGAEEDDAMPEDELKESIGVAVRDGSLALFGIPQVRGTGIEPEPGEIEGTGGTEEIAPAGPASGAEVEKGPPVAGETEATRPITAAADRIVGAAEMAVERCRELAGQRLVTRVKNRKCQACLDTLNGNPLPSLVASLLGKDTMADIDAPDPLVLVAGGAQSFIAAAVRLGVSPEQVADLADLVELHAARTLHDAQPAALPAAFHALVQRAAA